MFEDEYVNECIMNSKLLSRMFEGNEGVSFDEIKEMTPFIRNYDLLFCDYRSLTDLELLELSEYLFYLGNEIDQRIVMCIMRHRNGVYFYSKINIYLRDFYICCKLISESERLFGFFEKLEINRGNIINLTPHINHNLLFKLYEGNYDFNLNELAELVNILDYLRSTEKLKEIMILIVEIFANNHITPNFNNPLITDIYYKTILKKFNKFNNDKFELAVECEFEDLILYLSENKEYFKVGLQYVIASINNNLKIFLIENNYTLSTENNILYISNNNFKANINWTNILLQKPNKNKIINTLLVKYPK